MAIFHLSCSINIPYLDPMGKGTTTEAMAKRSKLAPFGAVGCWAFVTSTLGWSTSNGSGDVAGVSGSLERSIIEILEKLRINADSMTYLHTC